MRLASLLFVPILLLLRPAPGFPQDRPAVPLHIGYAQFQFPLVPFRQLPQDLQGWRAILRAEGVQDGTLYDELSVHTETRADGKRVAIITNVSMKPLFYWGCGGDTPPLYIEEMRGGIWLPNSCSWWERVPIQQKLMPGESRALLLPVSFPDQRRRFWTVFTNKPPIFYLPWLFTPYDIYKRVTPTVKTSLVFLKEEEG